MSRIVRLALLALLVASLVPCLPLEAQLRPVVSPGEEMRLGVFLQPAWQYRGERELEDRQGFFLRRARLDITGSLLEGRVRYRLLPDLARSPELRDAWVEVRSGESGGVAAGIRMGQQTVPFDLQRERNMGLAHFGERAVAARRFELSGGRDVGAMGFLRARDGHLQLFGGIFNGQGPNRSDPGRSPLLGGRLLLSVGGPASRGETDLARTPSPVLTLGAGAMHHRHSALRPRPGFAADRTVDWTSWTGDVHARWRGASLAAATFRQEIDLGGNEEGGHGFFVSTGWVLPPLVPGFDMEAAFRHSEATWDRGRDPHPDLDTGVGLTFFHRGHEVQTRIQLSRERRHLSEGAPINTRILTLEHQLLLGG